MGYEAELVPPERWKAVKDAGLKLVNLAPGCRKASTAGKPRRIDPRSRT
jgi:hypothetical protein